MGGGKEGNKRGKRLRGTGSEGDEDWHPLSVNLQTRILTT